MKPAIGTVLVVTDHLGSDSVVLAEVPGNGEYRFSVIHGDGFAVADGEEGGRSWGASDFEWLAEPEPENCQ